MIKIIENVADEAIPHLELPTGSIHEIRLDATLTVVESEFRN